MNFSGAQPSVFEGGAFDFAFFVCRVSVKTIQSTPQPFNPHFRPFTASHLAKPYFHAILPRVCLYCVSTGLFPPCRGDPDPFGTFSPIRYPASAPRRASACSFLFHFTYSQLSTFNFQPFPFSTSPKPFTCNTYGIP